jgi:hypothetical protein
MNETNKRKNDPIKQILYNSKYYTRILNKITRTNDVQEQREVKTKLNGPDSRTLDDKPNSLLSCSKIRNLKSL